MNEPISDRDPVEVLAEEFRARLRRGERPDVEEYARRHPDLAEQVRDLFPALLTVEDLKGAGNEALTMAPAARLPAGTSLEWLGDYRILREVGRGGMGVVYEAEQVSLGRRVALKVLPANALPDERQRKRFEREARSAARLHHTNIVPVYGVGEHEGTQYYVMQLIQGRGLDQVLTELRRLRGPREGAAAGLAADVARSLVTGCFAAPPAPTVPSQSQPRPPAPEPQAPPREAQAWDGRAGAGRDYWRGVARIGAQVAGALDYAATQGVLHRDVKPANLMLDAQGNVWVTDFGLAKAAADENLTHTAEVVGTLRYMAPERFDGRSDLRSDVYALGLTLYELLTLRPAFDGTDPVAVMGQVMSEYPVPPRAIDPSIPPDLETVVLKAMAREPERRYQTAAELAADLQRFLEDRPIRARRVRLPERLRRWCRRNPVVAALAAGVAVLLAGGALAALAAAVHAGSLARQERLARDEAVREQAGAEKDLARAKTERTAAEEARTNEAALRTKAERDRAGAEKSGQEAATAARQAEGHSQNARAVVDDFVARVGASPALRGPEMRRLRRDLLLSALPFYQEFIAGHAGDAAARPALAGAHFHAGEIRRGIDNPAEARKEYQAALALYQELAKADPGSTEIQIGLARSQAGAGASGEAVRTWGRLLASDPGNRTYQGELARAEADRGARLAEEKPPQKAEALATYERARALWTALVESDLDNADARAELARATFGLAEVLADDGRRPEAVRQLADGVKHAKQAFDRDPQSLEYGRLLAAGYGRLAELRRAADEAGEALPWCEKAVQLWQQLAEDNPTLATPRAGLHASYLRLAACRRVLGHDKEADGAIAAAAAVLDALPRQTPEEQFHAACVLALVARDADPEETKPAADRALDALRRAVAAGFAGPDRIREEEDLDTLRWRQDFRDLLARAEKAEKQRLAARTPAVIEAERRQALLANKADLAAGQYAIGLALIGLGNTGAAAEPLAQSLKLREALLTDDPDNARRHRADLGLTHVTLGEIDLKAGRRDEAVRAWRKGLDLLEAAAGKDRRDPHLRAHLADAERRVRNGYATMGRWAEAAKVAAEVVATDPADAHSRYVLPPLLLEIGDREGYVKTCREMLERYGSTDDPGIAERTAKDCLLTPEGVGDGKKVMQLATRAVTGSEKHAYYRWYVLCKGLADYREAEYARSLAGLKGLNPSPDGNFFDATIYAVMAMAHRRLSQPEEARQALERARAIVGGKMPKPERGQLIDSWDDWLRCGLLLREAEALIEGEAEKQ